MEKVIFDIARMRCGAAVEYDPAIVAASDIAQAISDLGYIAIARS